MPKPKAVNCQPALPSYHMVTLHCSTIERVPEQVPACAALSKEARMNLQEEKAMRLTAHEVVKDTLKAEGLLTQEAQGNLKADKVC